MHEFPRALFFTLMVCISRFAVGFLLTNENKKRSSQHSNRREIALYVVVLVLVAQRAAFISVGGKQVNKGLETILRATNNKPVPYGMVYGMCLQKSVRMVLCSGFVL